MKFKKLCIGIMTVIFAATSAAPSTLLSPIPVMAATFQTQDMYRLYNSNSGEHFYTAKNSERDHLKEIGWDDEGSGWIAPKSGKPIYRLYNPNAGDHHYTTNAGERDALVHAGWQYEGIGWYSGGSIPVYRQYNPNAKSGSHNYTTSKEENDALVRVGWKAEGIGWYASGKGRNSTDQYVYEQIIKNPIDNVIAVKTWPGAMSKHDYGRLLVQRYPDSFKAFDEDIKKCTSDLGKVLAIQKFYYDHDYHYKVINFGYGKYTIDGFRLATSPYGQCENYAEMTCILGYIADLPVIQINSQSHAWNEVKINGSWYALDNTAYGNASYKEYPLPYFNTHKSLDINANPNEGKEYVNHYDAEAIGVPIVSPYKKPIFNGVTLDDFTIDYANKRIAKGDTTFTFSEIGFND